MTVTGIFSWPRWIDSWPLPAIPTVLWRRRCYQHDYLVMDRRSTATLICDGQPGVASISRPLVAERDRLCPPARRRSSLPNTACLRGRSAETRLAQNGQLWGVVDLPAGGGRRVRGGAGCAAVLVLLPPVVRVLLRFGRRRTALADVAALGRGVFLGARLWVLRHVAGRRCAGLRPGRVGRWAVGG